MKTSTWKHFNFRDEFGEVKGGRNAKKENCEERTLRSPPESTAASASAAAADADAGALRGRADGDAVTEKRAGRCCSKKMRTCPGLVPASSPTTRHGRTVSHRCYRLTTDLVKNLANGGPTCHHEIAPSPNWVIKRVY
uniref:Uncharacterized protein n=1 Tax=Vespula pensylvanica TaxID=30213 RepID=A0A834P4Y2_VESPE|nr:hypothetical protein H0235_007055 [Vespula pensylvanica]